MIALKTPRVSKFLKMALFLPLNAGDRIDLKNVFQKVSFFRFPAIPAYASRVKDMSAYASHQM
jgi:hypothetical protein